MKHFLILGAACAMLAGCASQAEWAQSDPRNGAYITEGQVVGAMSPDDAMAAACKRKRTSGAIDPKWDAYCNGRGL